MAEVAPSTSTPAPSAAPSSTPAPKASTPAPSSTQNAAPKNLKSQIAPTPDAASPATKPAETPQEKWKRQFRFKVDGEERVEELDEDAATTRIQRGMAADKRFREAATRTQIGRAHV